MTLSDYIGLIFAILFLAALFGKLDSFFEKISGGSNTSSVQTKVMEDGGIGLNYEMYSFQMDCNEIIKEFQQKGYETVQLESHILKAPSNGKVGDIGTVDEVFLKATHVDEQGYFSITENYGLIYTYWGGTIGWDEVFCESDNNKIFDFSGLNNTYWKLERNDDTVMIYDDILSAMKILTTEEWDNPSIYEQVEIYVTFDNFDTFECVDKHSYASNEKLGTIVALSSGTASVKDFYCDYLGYTHKMNLKYVDFSQSWQMELQMDGLWAHTESIYWKPNGGLCFPVEKSEFEEALNKAEKLTGSGQMEQDITEDNDLENDPQISGTLNDPSIPLTYGLYSYDNGVDTICSAEVGFYTDNGSDYISINAVGYGDHGLIDFEGILEQNENGTYISHCTDYDATIICVFNEKGMTVTVDSTEFETVRAIEGFYGLDEEFNLDEVG